MRTFVAIALPDPVQTHIAQITTMFRNDLRAAQLDRCLRWVPATNLHLTVRFLGETTPTQVDAIFAGLSETVRRHSPLRLVVSKLGFFPNDRSPRVVWLGLEGDLESLGHLHTDVETAVQQAGYDPAPRALSPHLTIGRIRRGLPKPTLRALSARLKAASQKIEARNVGETNRLDFEVCELVLMRSLLKPEGAVYTPIEHFRFR